jgi:hypothetical protein
MKDLDFDELDQAVSSVLGKDQDTSKDEPAPKAADKSSDDAKAAEPTAVAIKPEPIVEKPADPTPAVAPAVSPAQKRRGQFLDMVHPSADMRSRSTPSSGSSRPKLAPVSNNVVPDEPAKPAAKPVETPAVAVSTTPEPALTIPEPEKATPEPADSVKAEDAKPADSAKDITWPDPLDVMSSSDSKTDEEPETEKSPEPTATPSEGSQTPFVTDAKVDKRPLGAFGAAESSTPAEETPAAESGPVATDIDAQKPPETTPPELQPDVVAVEAAADREFAGEGPIEQRGDDKQETPAQEKSGLSQSIPQQYKTPTEAPDQTPHPVFDTQEYHQPLLPATSQKKGRSWLVVLIIVLLLAVGAGLGYFAFVAGL